MRTELYYNKQSAFSEAEQYLIANGGQLDEQVVILKSFDYVESLLYHFDYTQDKEYHAYCILDKEQDIQAIFAYYWDKTRQEKLQSEISEIKQYAEQEQVDDILIFISSDKSNLNFRSPQPSPADKLNEIENLHHINYNHELLYDIMDNEEYNHTIEAESEGCDFTEWYDNPDARVLVVLLPYNTTPRQ